MKKTFLQFLKESKIEFPKTIALVAGSMKPPTVAHFDMVQQYAKMADEVIVLISDPKSAKSIRKTSSGTTITAEMAKEIMELYVSRYGLQNKVKVIVSPEPSPVTAMFKYVDDNLKDVNVIFGVSKKGGDEQRFKTATKYYEDNEHINLIDPLKTAVNVYTLKDGTAVSATDVRNNIENPEFLKKYLPSKLNDQDVQKVLNILEVKPTSEAIEESKEDLDTLDEEEDMQLDITDDLLSQAKILAYNVGQMTTNDRGKEVPVNPKKCPTKAVDIIFPAKDLLVEVYLDTNSKKWNSKFHMNGQRCHLSPEQMGQFFSSAFYTKLIAKLSKEWPLSDEYYGKLFEGIMNKEMAIEDEPLMVEADEDKEKDDREYTASGRKIVNFSDFNVNSKDAKFFCWPDKEKLYRWSTWKDWKKIKPLCRMRFKHGDLHYGLSLSVIADDYKNRGFRAYDVDTKPSLQWCTKEETTDIMKLSIVDKFIRHCVKKISDAISEDPEEIYKKINNPDNITVEEIAKTQRLIRNTLNEIIKKKQIDSFKWS